MMVTSCFQHYIAGNLMSTGNLEKLVIIDGVLNQEQIGSRLQRALRGYSLRKIALPLDVSHTAVRRWKKGTALPQLLTFVRLCSEFGLSADDILGLGKHSELAVVAEPGKEYGADEKQTLSEIKGTLEHLVALIEKMDTEERKHGKG